MKFFTIIISMLVTMAANAAGYSGQDYSGNEARRTYQLELGVIQEMRPVVVSDESTTSQAIGGGIGGLVGGLIGNAIGSGNNRYAIAAAMATVGAVGGAYATKAVMTSDGMEYVIRLDDGRVIAIVQGVDNSYPLSIGDRVRLVHGSSVKVAKVLAY